MTPTVVLLALFAAVLHATWNAFLRSGADRLWAMVVMGLVNTVAAAPLVLILPAPDPAAWPYIAGSMLLQVAYSVFLIAAYDRGELGQVYPVVRGSVPLLLALSGWLLAGERLTARPLAGVILVAGGILSLAVGKERAPLASVLLAVATGAMVATYSTIDAIGVRLAGSAFSYAAWICFPFGFIMPFAYLAARRRLPARLVTPDTPKALIGGFVSMISYGAVMLAFSLGPVAPISAMRETSVVFAVLIAWLFLGESLTWRRALACGVVALGAVLISWPP